MPATRNTRLRPEQVVVERADSAVYPKQSPFSPSEHYPEAPFRDIAGEANNVYATVRKCFQTAGLDPENSGTDRWNPLGEYIRPGDRVLLKPNLIKATHPRDPNGWVYMLTHGSMVRAAADYVSIALAGRGAIVLADAPQTDSSFTSILSVLQLDKLANFYNERGISFELVDLRQEEWETRNGVIHTRVALPGDPHGNIAFDLQDSSELVGHRGAGRYYGADYDSRAVNIHHTEGRHEYLIGGSAISADVVLNLPKLKTHKKAGITVSLKNLVGINGDKNWLPHHTEGAPASGGDERPAPNGLHRLERWGAAHLRELTVRTPRLGTLFLRRARQLGRPVFGDTEAVIRSGNWWGNDTIWRMCLDLNKILLYGGTDGTLRAPGPLGRKRYLVLVDGIIAGEGRGPINPDPVPAGLVMFGTHPASVDAAAAIIMGFDPDRIPIVRQAFRCREYSLAEWNWPDVEILSESTDWLGQLPTISASSTLHFEPHFAWKGHIERTASLQDA